MKKALLSFLCVLLLFPLITSQVFAQSPSTNFYLVAGTLKCDGVAEGFTEVIGGNTYEAVSETTLRTKIDNDESLSYLCTSHVTDMNSLFWDKRTFDQDISNWDVSKVTDMNGMFLYAEAFNQDLSNWNVSNVKNMEAMFDKAKAFNKDLSNWDVSEVTNMKLMFHIASAFNKDISTWDVSNVQNMNEMFSSARAFNKDISTWDVSKVANMEKMFRSAWVFDQNLNNWCVSQITNKPTDFNGGTSALAGGNLPAWGKCPAKTVTLTGVEGWRMLANPVPNSSYATFLSPIWTQGITGSDAPGAGVANVFTWKTNTATSANTNWEAISDMTTTMQPGSAALVYVYGDDNYTDPGSAGFPKTLSVKGAGGVKGKKELSTLLNTNDGGYTLLGNPFRLDIDWNEFTKSGLSETVHVWDANSSGWKSYNGTSGSLTNGIIGAFNGFFVQTSGTNPTLTIKNKAKEESGTDFLGKEVAKIEPNYFALQLQSEAGFSNKAWFQFSEDGDFGIDAFDAFKLTPLSSRYVSLASASNNNTMLDINNLPFIQEAFEIPLELNTTEVGEHTISLKNVHFPEDWSVELYDRYAQNSSTLREAYTFTVDAGKVKAVPKQDFSTPPTIAKMAVESTSKEDSPRFSLRIAPATAVGTETETVLPQAVELQQNYPNPFNPSTTIAFGIPESGKVTLEVFDMLGRKVASLLNAENKPAGSYSVMFNAHNLASGLYIYRLQTGNSIITKKLTLVK